MTIIQVIGQSDKNGALLVGSYIWCFSAFFGVLDFWDFVGDMGGVDKSWGHLEGTFVEVPS